MTDENGLSPCPFCGGKATFKEYESRVDIGCCHNELCSVKPTVYWQTAFPEWKEEAITAWNTRAPVIPSAEIDAALEALDYVQNTAIRVMSVPFFAQIEKIRSVLQKMRGV